MLKIMSSMICSVLAIGVALAQEASQNPAGRSVTNDTAMFITNRCFSKGGLGIVNESLYIFVKSARSGKNELILKPTKGTEQRWSGESVAKAEVVIFYEGKVFSNKIVPDQFDLSKAVIISFERDKVRFFNFQTMFGGYYDRINN